MAFGLGPAGWFMYPGFINPYLYGYPRFPYGGLPGYGYGYPGYGYGYPMTKEQERGMLEQDAKALEAELDRIRKRLEELKG
jgi:hypothetical protein